MKITREMTMELNNELAIMGCPFRYKFTDDDYNCFGGNPQIELVLPSMNYVNSFIINPTVEFIIWLYNWFKVRGIDLVGNNDNSILWSRNGWDME